MSLRAALEVIEDSDAFVALLCRQHEVALVAGWEWRRARTKGLDLDADEQAEAAARLAGTLTEEEQGLVRVLGLLPVPTAHATAMQTVEPSRLTPDVRRALRVAQEYPNDD